MNIDEAARATRKYWSAPHWEYQDVYFADHAGCDPENVGALYGSWAEAQIACDRLNLLAVLEAILRLGDTERAFSRDFVRTVEALIAEVKAQK